MLEEDLDYVIEQVDERNRAQTVPRFVPRSAWRRLKEVEAILDAYTARRPEMARSLMRKYERGTKTGNRGGNRLKAD